MEAWETLPRAEGRSVSERGKWRGAIEIAVAYMLILAVEWTPRPLQSVLWMVAALGLVVIGWRSFVGWGAMGCRVTNLRRALWIVGVAGGLACLGIAVAARMHTLRLPAGPVTFVASYCAYIVWAGAQQLLLQGVFLSRCLRLISSPAVAVLAAAALFAGAHLPNPVLTPITFIWGLVACLLFLRYRNIYPLMIAHAILGITVAMTIPGPVDHNMRVGLSYLRYDQHRDAHRMLPLSKP
jgi:membrane protease YdiL (CAAX protease family)